MKKIPPSNMESDLDETNLSLAGCGYLGIYHVGVASCIRKFAPYILTKNKISGASVGALVAAAFACDISLEACTWSMFEVSMRVRYGILGPITPDLNIMQMLYDNMSLILPDDAHLRCNGRLFISVTRYDDCQNVLLSNFESKEDLLRALMCSCFIPLYCGYEPPEFHGVAYVDGGYSNNSPKLDRYTVQVAPFSGTSGICPRDKNGDFKNFNMNNTSIYITLNNCRRLFRILFPGPPDMLKELCQKGFNDALLFLRDRGVVKCPYCISKINGNEVSKHEKCRPMEQIMPSEICKEIDLAVKRLNQNFSYRLFQNPIVKMLYYVNIPSIFTVKMSCALLSSARRKLQNKASSCVDGVLDDLSEVCTEIIQNAMLKSKLTCHIDFEESPCKDGQTQKLCTTCDKSNSGLLYERMETSVYSNVSEEDSHHNENARNVQENGHNLGKGYSQSDVLHFSPKSSHNIIVQDITSDDYTQEQYSSSKNAQNNFNNEEDKPMNTKANTLVF